MSISLSPEAATVETRASKTTTAPQAMSLGALLAQRLDRRSAARILAASGIAVGLGGASVSNAGAQEAPPAEDPDGWSDDEASTSDEDWSDTTTDETATTDDTAEATDATESTSTEPATDTAGGSGNGQAIADFALQYVGLPYASAGRDPSTGFDCSGFTYYVIMNVLGIDIGGSPEGQVGYGSPVEYGAWQPGDLVFFANTFREGISHVGIAIGGSQMVHAENESTGVTISDITSDYYASHYASASRL